jgi:hypothetical protein
LSGLKLASGDPRYGNEPASDLRARHHRVGADTLAGAQLAFVEQIEALGRNGGEHPRLVTEVMRGCGVGNAGRPGESSQAHLPRPAAGDDVEGGVDKRAPQVVVGTSSFAADITGKAEIGLWLDRFAAMHPRYEILDVMVSGPPWNTRVGVRMRDRIGDDYSNEGMHYLLMRWDKVCYDRVFVDTEAVSAFEQRHPEVAGVG